MYILGVNGILGCHDSSACLIKDGKIVSFVEEERFTLKRYAVGQWPHNAIANCLREENISLDDVDYIANGWNIVNLAKHRLDYMTKEEFINRMIPKGIFEYKKCPIINMYDHHICHASSAARTSGWDTSAVIVIDGEGENESISLYEYRNGNLKKISSYPIHYSLGFFYDAICKFVGLSTNEAGKLMGLAAYGKKNYEFNDIGIVNNEFVCNIGEINIEDQTLHDSVIRNKWMISLTKQFGNPLKLHKTYHRELNMSINEMNYLQFYKDIAYSAQNLLNNVVAFLINKLIKETNIKNIAYSGGVALNCVTNEFILNNTNIENLYIFPAANDAGTSVGAALELYHEVTNNVKNNYINHISYGPEFSNDEIIKVCNQMKINYFVIDNPEQIAAEYLYKNKIVAWFKGRMECGPRALGNRSILANPTYIENVYRINYLIKNRELWRPFAPSILEERYDEYISSKSRSKFMLYSSPVKRNKIEKIPAVVHVDGTTRPQLVSQLDNPIYWKLINEFYKKSGVAAVLNTSFNIKGEPIVCSPYEAIKAFYLSNIDILIMENILIKKERS